MIWQVLDFWFKELAPEQWWLKDQQLDQTIAARFGLFHQAAIQGECQPWRVNAEGRLAEIIILDQFSRNLYRDQPKAFSSDLAALLLAQEAVSLNIHDQLSVTQQAFLFMPAMHSESTWVHQQAVEWFSAPGLEKNLAFELQHKAIIDRFGRYPHRNAILGRTSTQAEIDFLATPGSSF